MAPNKTNQSLILLRKAPLSQSTLATFAQREREGYEGMPSSCILAIASRAMEPPVEVPTIGFPSFSH